jgi:hypothetical protein
VVIPESAREHMLFAAIGGIDTEKPARRRGGDLTVMSLVHAVSASSQRHSQVPDVLPDDCELLSPTGAPVHVHPDLDEVVSPIEFAPPSPIAVPVRRTSVSSEVFPSHHRSSSPRPSYHRPSSDTLSIIASSRSSTVEGPRARECPSPAPMRCPSPAPALSLYRHEQGDVSLHRHEHGWSGEWGGNVENMDEVMRSLRGLKAK